LNDWIPTLLADWLEEGHTVRWVHHPHELASGDFCFLLGCGQLVKPDKLRLHKHNLVVHESDLPHGRGWSPMTWQVLEGAQCIPVTLMEAVDDVDAGKIYLQEWMELEGHEFIDELRAVQAGATQRLCRRFVQNYPAIVDKARPQTGEPTWYPRRLPAESEIDPYRPLVDQFNLLRVVDNLRYPAFFRYAGRRYLLSIEDECELPK